MDEDIEFLRDFLECDRYRIAELVDSISDAMHQLGRLLHNHVKGPYQIIYRDENDPMYELIQLLDGNNFEVHYGFTYMGLMAAKVAPFYMEIIEVEYTPEPEVQSTTTTYAEYNNWTLDPPEIRNPSRRGLRAKIRPIKDVLFDESLKPPQRRKE